MNFEEYLQARDKMVSEYERKELTKYGLDHIIDKLLYAQEDLKKKNEQLEKKLDDLYKDLTNANLAQASLLPKKVNIAEELKIAAQFIPSQYVSGDTYNIFRLDEDHVAIYQIDISGHGVSAALFSVTLTQMLSVNTFNNFIKTPKKTAPFYKINSPLHVISLLNEEKFIERYDIYFTMIYMIINIKTGAYEYCRAGHNPPVVVGVDKSIIRSNEGGFPIGWDFERNDPLIKGKLNPGDRIFLFSDGVVEARDKNNITFGDEKLFSLLINSLDRTVDDTLNDIIRKLSQFTGKVNFEDDISIIGLQYLSS